jgi:Cu(I)/Ag(I) efflux system membrane fusion protein
MKKNTLVAVAIMTALLVGVLAGRHWSGDVQVPKSAENEILYWVAPMDPDFRRDEPGKSPMGMDLMPVYANAVDALRELLTTLSEQVSSTIASHSSCAG